MIKDIFEQPPSERVARYLKFAEHAAQRAAYADGAEKESYEKLAIEWRAFAATLSRSH